MPVTIDQVINQLDREEPNYTQAAQLGAEALPHLITLIQGENLGLAAKAASLAGIINADRSTAVLEIAARHSDPVVRVAAAASFKNLTRVPTSLAVDLLDDQDVGVRKWALKSLATQQIQLPTELKTKIQQISKIETNPTLRQLANQITDQLQ